LKIEQISLKEWYISHNDNFFNLKLYPSSITNKFFILTNYIMKISELCGDEFNDWFIKLLKDAKDQESRPKVLSENIDKIKYFSDKYIDSAKIEFSNFVDESKAKKNSILFDATEIEKIVRLSGYLKIYFILQNSDTYRLGQTFHKTIYNKLSNEALQTGIIRKVFDVIKTKTYRYNMTDKFMWKYIQSVQGKDIGSHIVDIFNFIMSSIIVLCEEDKNPITFFVGVIDESVKWFLRSVYKGSFVYGDTVATEDIQGINVDNLRTYSYNDTLGRLKNIAYSKMESHMLKNITVPVDSKGDDYLVNFRERVESIQHVSPLCDCLVYPLLARITSIPYQNIRLMSPEQAIIMSVYMKILLTETFNQNEYTEIFKLLSCYPAEAPSKGSTYRIRNLEEFIKLRDSYQKFFGFSFISFIFNIISYFVGKISRVKFIDVGTGQMHSNIKLNEIEKELVKFYMTYFSGNMDEKIKLIENQFNNDF